MNAVRKTETEGNTMAKGKKNLLNYDHKWHYAGTSDGLSVRLGGSDVLSGQ